VNVFVSYRRAADFAKQLTEFVEQLEGYLRLHVAVARVFLDTKKIDVGDLFDDRIAAELEQTDVFIVVMTPTWYDSEWCREELMLFRGRWPAGNQRVVVIEWVATDALETPGEDELEQYLHRVQRSETTDWKQLQHESKENAARRQRLADLAGSIARIHKRASDSTRAADSSSDGVDGIGHHPPDDGTAPPTDHDRRTWFHPAAGTQRNVRVRVYYRTSEQEFADELRQHLRDVYAGVDIDRRVVAQSSGACSGHPPGAGTDGEHVHAEPLDFDLGVVLVGAWCNEEPTALELAQLTSQRAVPVAFVLCQVVPLENRAILGSPRFPKTGRPVILWGSRVAAWQVVANGLRQLLDGRAS